MGRKTTAQDLGRRERQIMDAIFQLGEASVGAVRRSLPDPPSYSAVRTMIGSLEQKGLLKHRRVGIKYVYRPTQSPAAASRSASSTCCVRSTANRRLRRLPRSSKSRPAN